MRILICVENLLMDGVKRVATVLGNELARTNDVAFFSMASTPSFFELNATLRTCLVSFKNYLQEGQYNHLKTAVKGTFTVFPKSPTFV
jgi:hypothetical protein